MVGKAAAVQKGTKPKGCGRGLPSLIWNGISSEKNETLASTEGARKIKNVAI
jgi:hypothetical protein